MALFSAKTFRIPPETSLPITTPPCPFFMVHAADDDILAWNIDTPTVGISSGFYCNTIVAAFENAVFDQNIGAGFRITAVIVRPEPIGCSQPTIDTFLQRTGFINHIGEFLSVTPCSSTFLHRYGSKKFGLRYAPSPKVRSATGTFFSPISRSRLRPQIDPAYLHAIPLLFFLSSSTNVRSILGHQGCLRLSLAMSFLLKCIYERRIIHTFGSLPSRNTRGRYFLDWLLKRRTAPCDRYRFT